MNSVLSQTCTSPHQDTSTPCPTGTANSTCTGPNSSGNRKPIPQGFGVLCSPRPPPSQPAGLQSPPTQSSLNHAHCQLRPAWLHSCDTTVASSQRSLPKPRHAPLTSPESHSLCKPATSWPLRPSSPPELMLFLSVPKSLLPASLCPRCPHPPSSAPPASSFWALDRALRWHVWHTVGAQW